MPKPTARRSPSRRKGLRTKKGSGLIAKRQTRKRSVGTKSALDNRSHRTPQLTCGRIKIRSECAAFANPQIARRVQRSLYGRSAMLARQLRGELLSRVNNRNDLDGGTRHAIDHSIG